MSVPLENQVLLLHGFTGSVHDMAPLENDLIRRGMLVGVPELPGHGTRAEDMLDVTWQDWVQKGREQLSEFSKEQPRIIVALSMGTFIATLLAAEKENRVDAIILLSPAFVLTGRGRLAAFLSHLGLHLFFPFIEKRGGSDICDPKARAETQSYPKIPIKSLLEFDNLRKIAISKLKNVTCPVLVGFGQHDHTVDIEKARKELEKLGSSKVEFRLFAHSAHVLPVDFDREEVCKQVAHFIETL